MVMKQRYKDPKPRRLCLHAMRLDIPGYAPIEAPLPEDMQSIVAQLRAQRRIKPFPFHFGRGDKAMTFVGCD